MTTVLTNCTIDVIDDEVEIHRAQSPKGKPFLRLTFPSGEVVNVTTNIAEMIGGAGAGVRKRHEDRLRDAQ